MPSWKKVITSGSNASLAQISASIVPTVTGNENLLAYDSTTGGITQITQVNAGDNLGNHTATEDLNMATFSVQGATHVTASGTVQADVLKLKDVEGNNAFSFEYYDKVFGFNYNGFGGVGQQDIATIAIPGVSSLTGSAAFINYIKVIHVATDKTSGATNSARSQVMTSHITWCSPNSGPSYGLEISTTEEVKSPLNQVIIDPTRTTGTFDANGNIVLSIYHYDVENANHRFKYFLM
tara:strand:+ start:917 stop:1627 length:711 start_codon:yes stop_codon:yes gene_type:complete